MNILSFLATASATYFVMIAYQRVTDGRQSRQNLMAVLVLLSLGWWCLCDAFFYSAPTEETAWFWHRMGAPGWCGFIALTSYYFIVMTGRDRRMGRAAKAAFWIVPAVLVVRFMAFAPSGIADGLVESGSGLGWTYVQGFGTVWPYLLLAYLVVYFGAGMWCLVRWRREAANRAARDLARGYIVVDLAAVAVGLVSLFVVPQFTTYLPPLGFVATMVFGLGYWTRLRDYDFEFVELALIPTYVYEHSIDGLVVTDEERLVLYANAEARRILGDEAPEGKPFASFVAPDERPQVERGAEDEDVRLFRGDLAMASGIPAMCSVNRAKVRSGQFDLLLVHLADVSELKEARDELEYMAYHDPMTGASNRRRLEDLLDERVRAFAAGEGDFSLLFMDVAGFKQVNDTFGHAVGDAALMAVANALKGACAAGEEVVRYAGDEFVVLGGADHAELAARMDAAVAAIDGGAIVCGLSIGIDIGGARYSEAGSVDDLLRLADARMYAKKNAR
ncbi:sensor domain-containing diguanylate cyclase [Arabiibacter massiliensis]|uniref:sensor domain-containing diguanylate cyclase n=1 Tax=Arabiibacter massiliensis TaxID=1870985 RepID=UPI00155A920D|nr:diguanylate cyclase [Arabiibacter massiliensis]